MYVVPQTVFKLISGVPFNNDYKHTIWFTSASQQMTYFESKVVRSFTDFTYIRKDKVVRVPVCADDVYQCNYCMFQNAGFGNKWFFAFITNIEYANNDACFISIEIDYIQSWMFNMVFNTSFVEREHVANDAVGLHTVPENIDFGDVQVLKTFDTTYVPAILLQYASDQQNQGSLINNTFCAVNTFVSYPTSDDPSHWDDMVSAINGLLNDYSETPERIVNLMMGVKRMASSQTHSSTFTFSRSNAMHHRTGNDVYTPVNNKLLSYPYCFFTVDDYNGNVQQFKWEDFTDSSGNLDPTTGTFVDNCAAEPTPVIELNPIYYKSLADGNDFAIWNRNYGMRYTNFPRCPYLIDNYRAWCASVGAKQQVNMENMITQATYAQVSDAVGTLSNAVGAATSIANGDYEGVAALFQSMLTYDIKKASRQANIAAQSKSNVIDRSYAKTHGTSVGGSFGDFSIAWADGRIGWHFTAYCIRTEYARIIDDYLSRFGYKVNRYKIPELTSRQSFNYVKTVECQIGGNIPNDANSAICAIFNSGITLWHTTQVGNYSLSNEIVGE